MNCSMVSDAGSSLAAIRAVMLRPELGPEVADQVRLRRAPRPRTVTSGGSCACRSSCQPGCSDLDPFRIGRRVVAHRRPTTACAERRRAAWHPGRGAAPAGRRSRRCRRARRACRRACRARRRRLRRCSRSPSARSGSVCPVEVLDPGDARQLRPVVGALRHHDEAGADVVAAVGGHPPALDRLRPSAASRTWVEKIAPS